MKLKQIAKILGINEKTLFSKKNSDSSEQNLCYDALEAYAEQKLDETPISERLKQIELNVKHGNYELLALLGELEFLNESSYFIDDALFVNRENINKFRKIIIEG